MWNGTCSFQMFQVLVFFMHAMTIIWLEENMKLIIF